MIPLAIKRSPLLGQIVKAGIRAEEWWYDKWHRVNTCMDGGVKRLGAHHFIYEPTRPGRMRAVLKELPIDYSKYIFIDVGSGKGRPLLVASELPFRAVLGIEYDRKLHDQAVANIRASRYIQRQASKVESICTDAAEFQFPVAPLVLYFFNPFGQAVMEKMMARLVESLSSHPRDIFIVMFNPEYGFVVDRTPAFKLYKEAAACRIYRSQSHTVSESLTARTAVA